MTFASHFLSYFILILLSSLRTGPALYAQVGSPSLPPSFCSRALDSSLEEAFSQLVIRLFHDGNLSIDQIRKLVHSPSEFIEIIGLANVKTSAAIEFFKEIQADEPDWDKISDTLSQFAESVDQRKDQQREDKDSGHPIVHLKELLYDDPIKVNKSNPIHKITWNGRPALIASSKREGSEPDSMIIFDPVAGKVLKKIQIPRFDHLNGILDVVETENGHLLLANVYNGRPEEVGYEASLVLYRLEDKEVILVKTLDHHDNVFRFHFSQNKLIAYGHAATSNQVTVIQIHEEENEWDFRYIDLKEARPNLPNLEALKHATFEYNNEFYLGFFSHAINNTPPNFHLVNLSQVKWVSDTPMEDVNPSPPYITPLDTGQIIALARRTQRRALFVFDPFNPKGLQPTLYLCTLLEDRFPAETSVDGKKFIAWTTTKGLALLPLDKDQWSSIFGLSDPGGSIETEFPLHFKDTPPFSVWSFEQAGTPFLLLRTISSLTQVTPVSSEDLENSVGETLDFFSLFTEWGFRFDSQGSSYLVTVQDDHSIKTFHVVGPAQ